MIRTLAAVLAPALLLAACSRPPAPLTFTEYRDELRGFSISHPSEWQRAAGAADAEVRFAPRAAGAQAGGAEFISVFSVQSPSGNTESEIRRQVFALLPIHGVSGFQQDARTSAEVLWFRFEVTGSSAGTEWASVGAVAAGKARMQVAVCAKPLPQWRQGQRQCDEVIRSFRPGDLGAE
ncbi:MAG: hypothetical protein ACRDF6_01100 [bacterium]